MKKIIRSNDEPQTEVRAKKTEYNYTELNQLKVGSK